MVQRVCDALQRRDRFDEVDGHERASWVRSEDLERSCGFQISVGDRPVEVEQIGQPRVLSGQRQSASARIDLTSGVSGLDGVVDQRDRHRYERDQD